MNKAYKFRMYPTVESASFIITCSAKIQNTLDLKCRIKLSKMHEKVVNQRRDFLQKLSYNLITTYDYISIEDLNMQAMSRALKFGKSVHDNGWGMFTRMLEYKSKWYGKILVKIDKFEPTGQTCHCCGYKNPKTKDLKEN